MNIRNSKFKQMLSGARGLTDFHYNKRNFITSNFEQYSPVPEVFKF